jgi:hypothetical protein
MRKLWDKEVERQFFVNSIKKFAAPEQLFYVTDTGKYLAYWPKGYKGKKDTLQSRNALIGSYTEKWTSDLLQDIVSDIGLYALPGVICEEIALSKQSSADVAICKNKSINQKAENIVAIFEVKMSIVWNWEFIANGSEPLIECIGNFKTHEGNPGLLRSDSMLKAIGKSINIRISSPKATTIPIYVIGNTPITPSYYSKVDHLKTAGIIQGFLSVTPDPLDNKGNCIKTTAKNGFYRFDSFSELNEYIHRALAEKRNFFSSMKSKNELGRIIEIADNETTYEKKAEKFLALLEDETYGY